MSGTLFVWKAPRVPDEDAAARLVREYLETGDDRAFESSPDVLSFYDEVVGLHPPPETVGGAEDRVTWASTPERSDRIVEVDYAWSAPSEFLDDVARLARERGLVLYDPQGPTLYDPDDPGDATYVPNAREVARVVLLVVVDVVVAAVAWYASITIVSWVVVVVAAFLAVMGVATLVVYARDALRRRSR